MGGWAGLNTAEPFLFEVAFRRANAVERIELVVGVTTLLKQDTIW